MLLTLDIAPLRSESSPQKRSGMARVLKGSHNFTCIPTRSSASRMSHTGLCLPSRSWYSFTDPRGMEGWVDLGGWLRSETVTCPKAVTHSTTNRAQCRQLCWSRPTRLNRHNCTRWQEDAHVDWSSRRDQLGTVQLGLFTHCYWLHGQDC